MGHQPDIEAFTQYVSSGIHKDTTYLSIPRRITPQKGESPSPSYMLVNVEGAARTPETRNQTESALKRHFQSAHMSEKEITDLMTVSAPIDIFSPKRNLTIKDFLEKSKDHGSMLVGGGGAAAPKFSLFMADGRTMTEIYKSSFTHATPENQERMTKLMFHHEAAHLLLRLDEPGSDFVAAALMLREDPGSRFVLRQWADSRLLSGISGGGKAADSYGSECHDAVERALSIPSEKLKSMSITELHAVGAQYDNLNNINNLLPHSAEENVRSEMQGLDVGKGLRFLWNKISGFDLPSGNELADNFYEDVIPVSGMQERLDDLDFPKNSPEQALANNVAEALTRVQARNAPSLKR